MAIHSSVLELIGRTPIVKAQRLDTGVCELYLKLESANPGGSIKDRIGLSMIEAAEKRGDLKPGATLVEGTAGNTGLGLALVAQQKGYKLILVVPDKMSREKIFNLKAMGAEVVLTRSDVAKGHPEYYQDLAKTIAERTPGAYFVNQFGNPDNPAAHEFGTGPEILEQMDGDLDAIVFGNKYLSKMYNDYWMLDNGFLERPRYGDLRDLILRPYSQRDTVVVGPNDLLTTAYQRMKLYDVSQLPVMDGDRLVGIIDESDVLLHVYGDEARFRDPVAIAMVSKLDRLDVKSPIEALLPVFDRGQVAIIMDGADFLGLITRIDLLNYLRRRVQ